MILDNGTVRTLDPQLPASRALAIAGDRIAGGVGVHETALASPEVVDLGGRCVLPGFTDSHVHFPTWRSRRTRCGSRQLPRSRPRSQSSAMR
jgi:predicted amidohydrolase YtcJ